jgi:hypothetical protein
VGSVRFGLNRPLRPARIVRADPSAICRCSINRGGIRDHPARQSPAVTYCLGASAAAAGFAAAPAGAGGLRTMITSTMSGATTPPMIRSIELTLTESLLIMVWICVADVGRPSRKTPWALTTHSFSFVRLQRPSP